MNRTTVTHLLFLVYAAGFGPVAPALGEPHLLAHRGLCQHAPENTLPAYAAAIDLGLDIETDVYQTRDNHLVLIHDKTLDRTTDGTGPVTEKTLAELRKLDAGSWFSPAYAGLKIPTFDELLELVKETQWRRTVIAVNMKTISPGIEGRICDTLRRHGMTDRCFVFAMDGASARRFRAADPTLARAISVRKSADFDEAAANPDYQCIWYYDKPTKAQIETAHKAGKRVWLSGSCIKNDPDCWANARTTGADGLCVNHPLEARERWRQMRSPNTKRPAPPLAKPVPEVPLNGPDTRPAVKTPTILAHRGLCKYAPENTLPAFAAAVDLGLGLEIDVYQTADDRLVIIHDTTVDRTTDGTGKVTEKTFDELRRLDAGAWFDPAYAGLKIPTLDEVLRLVKTRQWRPTLVAINMKIISPGIEERIVRAVEAHGLIDQVFAFGMDGESAARFRAANPDFPVSLHNRARKGWSDLLRATGYTSIWASDPPSTEQVLAAHQAGRRVYVFDAGIHRSPGSWKHALRIEADGICTDHPLEARKTWFDTRK